MNKAILFFLFALCIHSIGNTQSLLYLGFNEGLEFFVVDTLGVTHTTLDTLTANIACNVTDICFANSTLYGALGNPSAFHMVTIDISNAWTMPYISGNGNFDYGHYFI